MCVCVCVCVRNKIIVRDPYVIKVNNKLKDQKEKKKERRRNIYSNNLRNPLLWKRERENILICFT